MALGEFVRHDQRGIPRRIDYYPVPTDAMSNASYTLTYGTNARVEEVTKTIGTDSWKRTFTYTGDLVTNVMVYVVV